MGAEDHGRRAWLGIDGSRNAEFESIWCRFSWRKFGEKDGRTFRGVVEGVPPERAAHDLGSHRGMEARMSASEKLYSFGVMR